MRIAILTNAFPPDGQGGAERTAFLQADTLACLGHDVRVWSVDWGTRGRAGSGATERTVVHGMEVIRFSSDLVELKNRAPLSFFRLWFHLIRDELPRTEIADAIVAWKPDALLTHNLMGCGLGTARTVQKKGIRWIHTLHDTQLTDLKSITWAQSSIARAWRGFWSAWRTLFFGTPDVLVSPTRWLLDWHTRCGFHATQSLVIPNPIDLTPARERTLRTPATIAFVGRLSGDKGFDFFLQAIKRIPRALSLVGKIVVVGGGPLTAEAGRMNDPRLMLRGALSFEEARRAIADADLLIAPSQMLENQQTILLEAMVEGTPAIATDVGGTRETLEQTGCPIIPVDRAQGHAIAEAAIHLLSRPDDWQHVSRAMRRRAARHDKEKYFETLAQLLGSSG